MNSRYRLPALLAFPLAALVAIAAVGALVSPAVYAREVPLWAAQGRGQDWVDLVLVAPLLALTGWLTLRGTWVDRRSWPRAAARIAALLLAGTTVYALYSLVLYAFFLHFGPLFLVYALALGLSFYTLVGMIIALAADDVPSWFGREAPVRLGAAFTVLPGVVFYALWLSEVIPALRAGAMPQSAIDAGLITNPVHVLDLGLVLPAFIVGGVALARRRRVGFWLAPAMLAFGVVMDVALAAMVVSMNALELGGEGPPLGVFVAMTLVTAAVLVALLRHVRS